MMTNTKKQVAFAAIAVAAVALSGCATEDYVNERIATVQSSMDALAGQMNGRLGAVEAKTGEHDGRLAAVEKGKFNYQKVGEAALLFDTGSYRLKADEAAKLDAALATLKSADKSAYIEIEGFADPRGGSKSNRELGLRRAREVYNYLRDQGVALNRMMLFSHGEEHQVADASNDMNRRVVVSVVQ
jgi:peptidoglycan-associated lipoprotein